MDSKVRTESDLTGTLDVYDGDEVVFSCGDVRRAQAFASGFSHAKLSYVRKIAKWLEENDAEIVWGGFYYAAHEELLKKLEKGEL